MIAAVNSFTDQIYDREAMGEKRLQPEPEPFSARKVDY